MSPTSATLSFPSPVAQPPQQASGVANAESIAAPPSKSFRKVLDEQSTPLKAETTDSKVEAKKADAGKTADGSADGDSKPSDAEATDGKAVDGSSAVKPADAKTDAPKIPKNKAKGAGAKVTAQQPAESEDPGVAAAQNASAEAGVEALPTAEQDHTLVDEQVSSGDKPKDGKSAPATTTGADQSSAAATLTVALASAATASPTTASGVTHEGDSTAQAKGSDQAVPAPSAGKTSGASTLRAEDAVQAGPPVNSAAKQKTDDATGNTAASPTDASNLTPAPAADQNAVDQVAPIKASDHPATKVDFATVQQLLADATANQKANDSSKAGVTPALPSPAPTAADFAAANHAQIVNSVHTQLLPNGGSMQIRLDPPDLGAMQITVTMRDGVMSAEFQTSNDQAAKVLSHSLGDLKAQLETQGMTVEKLHVTSAPRETQNGGGHSDSRGGREPAPGEDHRREQQRKEMIRRMWSKLSKGDMPLDMVA